MRPIPAASTYYRTSVVSKTTIDDRVNFPPRNARKVSAAPIQKEPQLNATKATSVPLSNNRFARKVAAEPVQTVQQPQDSKTPPSTTVNELPLQLRQQKKNWDVSTVPRGNVLDRIKIFGGGDPGQKKSILEEDLTNTGKTNPALRKRRELEREQELQRAKELEEQSKRKIKNNGFGRSFFGKKNAATAIQSAVRMHAAKKIALRKADQAIARTARDARLIERERQERAATKLQAVARSSLTRIRVCRLVEQMIAELMEQSQGVFALDDDILDEADHEIAQPPETQTIPSAVAPDDFAEKVHPSAETPDDFAEKLEEKVEDETEKGKTDEEQRRMIEAAAAVGRANREVVAEDMAREKADAEARAEADRRAKEEDAKARKEAAAAERERRLKSMNLFVGPLPWGVGLLPDWWMDETPHTTLELDVITEEDNGEDFEEWRTVNVMIAT